MLFLRATWILFSFHLRKTLTSRRALVCAVLASVPLFAALLIGWVIDRKGAPDAVYPYLAIGWYMQVLVIVPIMALVIGSAVVAEEVDDRTITYLFTRPIPRPAILVGRWLASLVLILGLLAATSYFVFQTLDGALVASEKPIAPAIVRRLFWVILLGGVVYSGVFAALGALIRRPVIVGLGYTFAVEVFLGNLPGGNQALTIQFYLKSYLLAVDPAVGVALPELVSTELALPGEALRMLGMILGAALLLGSWAVARKQYVLPA